MYTYVCICVNYYVMLICLNINQIQRGDQYILRGGQLICRTDFEKELYMMQGFGGLDHSRCKSKIV